MRVWSPKNAGFFFFFKSLIDLKEISLMAWSDEGRRWIGGRWCGRGCFICRDSLRE